MLPRNFPNRIKTRRESAIERADARKTRSNAAQLTTLDERLGVGVGATRERAKLAQKEEKGPE